MLKNATPAQLAAYSAVLLTALSLSLLAVLLVGGVIHYTWWIIPTFLIASLIGNYFIISSILRRFIYRKIKVIYKTIHSQKRLPQEKSKDIDMNLDILGKVERDVADWATAQDKELEVMKKMETYRRQFLGNVSHELKTPIFNIQGYVHTLLDGGLEDEGINRSYLEKAAVNVDRLQTIVEDLESISKLETGELLLEIQPFDIRTLAGEVLEDLEMKAKRRHIRLSFKEGAERGYLVKADRESIRQVLTNLVSNSIKYGKESGSTKIGFYDMEKYILVEVADNGIGIGAEHIPHLFDRFYRVDKSRSRAMGGSGLGLSIVKHIVEAHQQTINVRSAPNVGSTFGFTLEKA